MNAMIGTEYVHKDIKKLHITKEGGASAVYTIQNINFSSQTFSWSPGEPLLDTATQLEVGDYERAAPDFPAPADKWLIYYKTDIEISPSSAAKIYTAQLSDAAGLRSNEVKCSTVKWEVGEIKLEVTNPSSYIHQSGETGEQAHPYSIRCDEDSATLKATCNTPGVSISYTVYDIISGTEAKKSEGSGASPLTGIRLITPGTVGQTKKYKVAFKATAPGFTEYTPDVYYTLTRAGGVTIDASVQNPHQVWKKLREAVANAAADDIITIKGEIKATNAGTGLNVNWGKITIGKNLTIRGKNGKNTDILNANTNETGKIHRIFEVQSGATLILSGLTLKDGRASVGAIGGGIFVASGGKVELSNCTIEGCKAGTGGNGGAIGSQGTVTITGSTLTGNSATNGAVYVTSGGVFTMHSGTISGNTVQSAAPKTRGGGVFVSLGTTFTMKGGTISGNTATTKGTSVGSKAMGGGVCVSGSGSKFIMEGNSPSISDNEVKKAGSGTDLSTIGGGVCVCDGAIFEMKAGSIENNKALEGDKQYFGHTGGGVCVGDSVAGSTSGATFTMKGGTISDNEAGYGGGVAVTSNSSFKMSGSDSKISGNKATYTDEAPPYKKLGSGGGVFVLYGTLDMTGGVINDNEAGYGGGIHGNARGSNNGEIIVSGNSTISNNIADSGGGITSEYKLSIKEHHSKTPTIKENTANSICGGIYLRYDNILSFTGGTVTGNTVFAPSGLGKGMYLETNSTKVEMSGSATVDKNNDVHLGGSNSSNYAYITVTGALTAQHAATLTVRSDLGYTEGREVVKGGGFPLTSAYINKFPITKQTMPEQEWTTELGTNALKLKKK